MSKSPTNFPDEIRLHCDRLGTAAAAQACGLSARTLQLWMEGKGRPAVATAFGALGILRGSQPGKLVKIIVDKNNLPEICPGHQGTLKNKYIRGPK